MKKPSQTSALSVRSIPSVNKANNTTGGINARNVTGKISAKNTDPIATQQEKSITSSKVVKQEKPKPFSHKSAAQQSDSSIEDLTELDEASSENSDEQFKSQQATPAAIEEDDDPYANVVYVPPDKQSDK